MTNIKKTTEYKVPTDEVEIVRKTESKSKGNFICLNTVNIKGTRLNLDSLESYGPNGDTVINLSRSTGKIGVEFASREERDAMLARIDSYCL